MGLFFYGELLQRIILIFLFFSTFSFSQYTVDDSLLLQTTFRREFNKQIINTYLTSDNKQKINAALLSISHSEDTSFINSIKELDFKNQFKFITFTLGQLGTSQNSTDFLLKKFLIETDQDIRRSCLETIGKTGDSLIYSYLIDKYFSLSGEGFDGISSAIYYFKTRGIEHPKTSSVLSNELTNNSYNYKRKEDAVFALFRTSADSSHLEILIKLIEESDEHSTFFEQYSLSIFKKLKFFPNSIELFKRFTESENWLIRNEISKSGVYFHFTNTTQLEYYLKLMLDSNKNVQRQFVISLREISFVDSILMEFVSRKLIETLQSNKISNQVYGELVITLTKLFPFDAIEYYIKYKDKLASEFVHSFLRDNHKKLNISTDSLIAVFPYKNENDKVHIIQTLLAVSESSTDLKLTKFILEQIEKGSPAVSGTIAAGLDNSFIEKYSSDLEEVILKVINNRMFDCDFTETVISLHELAVKISTNFAAECGDLLASSNIYALRKKFNQDVSINNNFKNDDYFCTIFNNAFKYKYATIKTEKGDIKIKFKPEIAPISTGSFIYLAVLNTFTNNLWHRVVPGFVIQGGDPSKTGWGGPGYDIISEFSPLNYNEGIVGMASAGKDTEGSQFFIMQAEHPHLNGRYTIFAEVVEGITIVSNLEQNDLILSIVLE